MAVARSPESVAAIAPLSDPPAHPAPVARGQTDGAARGAITRLAIQFLLTAAFLGIWQLGASRGWISAFLFGEPVGIARTGWTMAASGQLFVDARATVGEALAGFLIGGICGSVIGLSLWYSRFVAQIVEPFIIALNSVPKIAFAPIVILWFGTGTVSKVMLAVALTAIIALISAYQAAKDADPDLQSLMVALGASKNQIFFKVIVPSTLPAMLATCRINIGFGLVGAVVGEFISSKEGLGHLIYTASSFYDLNTVWVGLFSLMFVGFCLYFVVDALERVLLPWKQADASRNVRV